MIFISLAIHEIDNGVLLEVPGGTLADGTKTIYYKTIEQCCMALEAIVFKEYCDQVITRARQEDGFLNPEDYPTTTSSMAEVVQGYERAIDDYRKKEAAKADEAFAQKQQQQCAEAYAQQQRGPTKWQP